MRISAITVLASVLEGSFTCPHGDNPGLITRQNGSRRKLLLGKLSVVIFSFLGDKNDVCERNKINTFRGILHICLKVFFPGKQNIKAVIFPQGIIAFL